MPRMPVLGSASEVNFALNQMVFLCQQWRVVKLLISEFVREILQIQHNSASYMYMIRTNQNSVKNFYGLTKHWHIS